MSELPPNGGTLAYRVGELEKDIVSLQATVTEGFKSQGSKIDKLLYAILTLTCTIAGGAIVFALTVASLKGS